MDDDIKDLFTIDSILTVVDAKHIEQHLSEKKPDGVENESGTSAPFLSPFSCFVVDLERF